MNLTTADPLHLMPLFLIAGGILLTLTIEMFYSNGKKILPWLTLLILLAAAYFSVFDMNHFMLHFGTMFATGGLVNIFLFLFSFGAAIVVLLSIDYQKKAGAEHGEFYVLILSAVLGMMLIAGAKDLIMVFIGLEQMSVTFYILAGFNRSRVNSNESALKYFLLGAFATGFVVYGMALIFGTVHSLSLEIIYQKFSSLGGNLIFVTGMIFYAIGFSFKIAAFPFHMWVPDVYQGAPTTVTALMSTGGKAAAFSALFIVIVPAASQSSPNTLAPFFAILSVLSMFIGSITALVQDNIKRMLAYSSIAHAGYMLIGVASGSISGISGVVYYLIAYTFMNLAAFGIVSIIESKTESNLSISGYAGFASKQPVLAALLALSMFALSGIPPFAGFFGKYYVFIAAVQNNLTWLAILGVLSSVISVYFYLRVVVVMYFQKPVESASIHGSAAAGKEGEFEIEQSQPALLGVLVSSVLIILLGVMPGGIIDAISAFTK